MCSNSSSERDPAHATALGKAILAFQPEGEVKEIVKTRGLKRLTKETITDEQTLLKAELNRVRAAGYAVDEEESMLGDRYVGAPIFVAPASENTTVRHDK